MTSPTSVGQVSVDLVVEARALAKQIRQEVEKAFKGLDMSKAIQDSVGRTAPKIPVELDPDTGRAEATLRAKLAAIAGRVKETVHVNVDVDKRGGFGTVLSGIGNLGQALPGLGRLSSGLADVGGSIQKLTGSSAQLGGSLAGAFATAAGPIGAVVGSLLAVAGAAATGFGAIAVGVSVAIPAVTALAGALAALPGLLTGVGAGFGTLALGFKGIADAFKPKTGGGGGGGGNTAAQQARQIAAASRQVEAARRGITAANRGLAAAERNVVEAELAVGKAQDRARLAQDAVNRARREAVEDISDLNRELRSAQLGEKEAALAVTDALRDLNQVQLTGNIPDIQRAQNAYDRAVLSLEEAKDTTEDLGETSADANKKGVEGSDKVQDALRDQAQAWDAVKNAQQGVLDAQNGVLAAQDSLKSAYDGLASAQDSLASAQTKVAAGAGGVAKQVVKLAPAAQRFVDAIKALKPAFEDLRLDVQQRLFAGLDKTVTNLGNAWIPALKKTLGSYADTFNQFFRNLGTSITTPTFIADLQAGAEGFRKLFETLGTSITGKLIPAFGALSRASAPFLEALGDELARVVTVFSDWVLAGEKSGGLTSFFDKASQALHDIFDIGFVVADIIGSIFEIITGASPGSSQNNPLQSFRDALQKVATYLGDPTNQQKIRDFIGTIQSALTGAINAANKVTEIFRTVRAALGGDGTSSLWFDIGAGIITGILAGVAAQTKLVLSLFTAVWNAIVGHVKRILGIKSPSTVFAAIGVDVMRGLISGIGSFIGNLANTATRMRATITNALGGAGTLLVNTGRAVVVGLYSGISSMFNNLRIVAGNARVYIQNALSNAGTLLRTHGMNVIIGLFNGMASLGGWLYNRVASFVQNNVVNAVRNFLRISSPSKLMAELGGYTAQGLAKGMDAKAGLVQDAASNLAALAVPDVALGFDTDLDASISRSLAVADQKSLLLGWKTGTSGDRILDAIADHIDLRFNGNVQAALSRT